MVQEYWLQFPAVTTFIGLPSWARAVSHASSLSQVPSPVITRSRKFPAPFKAQSGGQDLQPWLGCDLIESWQMFFRATSIVRNFAMPGATHRFCKLNAPIHKKSDVSSWMARMYKSLKHSDGRCNNPVDHSVKNVQLTEGQYQRLEGRLILESSPPESVPGL